MGKAKKKGGSGKHPRQIFANALKAMASTDIPLFFNNQDPPGATSKDIEVYDPESKQTFTLEELLEDSSLTDPKGQWSPSAHTAIATATAFTSKTTILGYDTLTQIREEPPDSNDPYGILSVWTKVKGQLKANNELPDGEGLNDDQVAEFLDLLSIYRAIDMATGAGLQDIMPAAPTFKLYGQNLLLEQYASGEDLIRTLLGYYWSYNLVAGDPASPLLGTLDYIQTQPFASTKPADWSAVGAQPRLLKQYYQNIATDLTIGGMIPVDTLNGLLTPQIQLDYIDMAFSLNLPLFDGYAAKTFSKYAISPYYVKTTNNYNFYLPSYESRISVPEVPEYGLPNIYTFLHEAENEETGNLRNLRSLISLNRAEIFSQDNLVAPLLSNLSHYLKRFAKTIHKDHTSFDNLKHNKLSQTIGISIDRMDYLKMADDYKESFPMCIGIDIPTSNTGKVGELLKKSGLFDTFMKGAMIAVNTKTVNSAGQMDLASQGPRRQFLFHNEQMQVMPNQQEETMVINGSLITRRRQYLMYFSLNGILGSPEGALSTHAIANELSTQNWENAEQPTQDKYLLYGEKNTLNLPSQDFIDFIKGVSFKLQMSKFIDDNLRSVADVYKGKQSYSEVLFYEIVKYKIPGTNINTDNPLSPESSSFIQNIFIPNDSALSVLKYVDTQVKYGQKYYYQIFAHTIVIGTKYAFISSEQPEWEGTGVGHVSVNTSRFEPEVQLVRVPFYNTLVTSNKNTLPTKAPGEPPKINYQFLKQNSVRDKPPVFPDVNIVPFKGVNNRILVNFNFMGGEYELNPITLSTSEEARTKTIRTTQERPGGPLEYKTDEFSGFFEAYRLPFKPRSYEDFKPISKTRRPGTPLNSLEKTSFVDTLLPNQNYYYIFRVKDVHGSFSNPTPIYKVRIVDSPTSAPYTIISAFFIEDIEEQNRRESIPMMKYIKIKPTFAQSYIKDEFLRNNFDSAGDINNTDVGLGFQSESVFGKKFKVRFTSNRTGKKIDVNINVKRPDFVEKTDKTS